MARAMQGSPGSKRSRRLWYLLLLVPLSATVFPGLYSWNGPALFGLPFFYWYQMAWQLLTGAITGIVYYATR